MKDLKFLFDRKTKERDKAEHTGGKRRAAAGVAALAFVLALSAVPAVAASGSSKVQYKTNKSIPITIPEVEGDVSANEAASLPSKYHSNVAELDDLITSVKDQGSYGTCWAFSAISNAETSLVRKGIRVNGTTSTAKNTNLSELQLLYFFYHPVDDVLGNLTGDSTSPLTSNFLNQGGSGIFTTFAFANWTGVAEESEAPYEDASSLAGGASLSSTKARNRDIAHMQNAYWFNLNDTDTVKRMIQRYGNVSVSYYDSSAYYNDTTYAYYDPVDKKTNHSVNLVGWDDNYSKSNFVTEPSENGAWLVKNTRGTSFGDEGYFWISYEDVSLTQNANPFGYVYDFESRDNYDYNYQYDGSCGYHYRSVPSGSSVANVFTVKGSAYEELKAVSLASLTPGTSYSVQVYKNPDAGDPASGTPMLTHAQTGTMTYAGYITIPLDQSELMLTKGDTFSVVIRVSTDDGSPVRICMDDSYTNSNWIRFVNATEEGQSYMNTSDTWTDLDASGLTARIKAFTDQGYAVDVTSISLDRSTMTLTAGKSGTLTASTQPVNHTSGAVTWGTSNSSVATVSDGVVTAVSPGKAVITARIGSISAKCTVTVRLSTPVLKKARGTAYGKITVTWKACKGAAGYRIYRKTKGGKWTSVAIVKGRLKTSWTDTVTNLRTYYYTVRAYRTSGGKRVYSGYNRKGVSAAAVPARTTMTGSSVSTAGIRVTWKKVRCSGYRIFRKRKGSSRYVLVGTVSRAGTTRYTDRSAKAGYTYTYTVRPFFRKGKKTALGKTAKKAVTRKYVPSKPTLRDISVTSSGIRIEWKSVNCDGYRIYRRTGGGTWKLVGTANSGSASLWRDKTAAYGYTYTYTVRAYYQTGGRYGLSSFDKKGLSAIRQPQTPTLSGASSGSTGIRVKWKRAAGAQGYCIYRKTAGSGWKQIGTVNSRSVTSFVDTTAAAGTRYTYTVRSYLKVGGRTVLSRYIRAGVSAVR